MSGDLLDIARHIAGAANDGEQVEAYVMRAQETDVEVFGGKVESLTTAGVEGVGVRVIVDHRQGLAWAGSLDRDVVEDTPFARRRAIALTFGELMGGTAWQESDESMALRRHALILAKARALKFSTERKCA